MMRRIPAMLSLSCLVSSGAMACTTQPWRFDRPLAAVKADFDQARSVVIATVIHVENSARRITGGFQVNVERAHFRVERSFKGTMQPGATFHIESRENVCGSGVATSYRPPPPPPEVRRKQQTPIPDYQYPTQWLIYLPRSRASGSSFEVLDAPQTQPLAEAAMDIRALKKYGTRWKQQKRMRAPLPPTPTIKPCSRNA